jgi:hypothetical protein
MPSSQLFRDSQEQFTKEAKDRYKSSTDIERLRNFPPENMVPKDAKEQTNNLIQRAGKKHSRPWINKLMANIGSIVTIGNQATTGAPESVGLAWFAVKLTLSAIQSNYDLYLFIESALMDITDVMIIVSHYDRLYDERSKANGWKPSQLVDKLFVDIKHAYTAVLLFSFSVQRHLDAGALGRLKHGFRDLLGESKAEFAPDMARISDCKRKILEGSQAIFQDETLSQIDAVKGIVGKVEGTVDEIISFQKVAQKMYKEHDDKLALLLKGVEDIKSITKPKTAWDIANLTFEKNKTALHPQDDTSEALQKALKEQYPGTCLWIFKLQKYKKWQRPTTNGMLCIEGKES